VEVQVPGIDPQAVRELAIGQLLAVAGAQRLEDAQAQRVPSAFNCSGLSRVRTSKIGLGSVAAMRGV